MSAIRMNKSCSISRPSLNRSGQLVAGSGTTVICALWRRKLQQVIGPTGEVDAVTAHAYLPAGTDVERRDQIVQGGRTYVVLEVVPAENDLGVEDHIGVQLQEKG